MNSAALLDRLITAHNGYCHALLFCVGVVYICINRNVPVCQPKGADSTETVYFIFLLRGSFVSADINYSFKTLTQQRSELTVF